MAGEHAHAFLMIGRGTHFAPVPNTRHVPRPVYTMRCLGCGQPAFKYQSAPRVTYTWGEWATEADHEAAQARKSPLAKARRP